MSTTSNSNNNDSSTVENVDDVDTEWGRAIEKPKTPPVNDNNNNNDDDDDDDEIIDIAIVGGGLVGLAVAIGLLKEESEKHPSSSSSSKYKIKVYERAQKLRSKSQGILAIHPNGMNALEKIDPDIPIQILNRGCERHSRIVTNIEADGTIKEHTEDTGTESIQKYGRTAVGITWHNCQQVLASLVPNKSETIVTGKSLSYFIEHDDYVDLYFEDSSRIKARIVLGCDGVFSAIRRQLYPKDSPIYFGQLNWGTVIESSELPPNVHPKNGVHYFQHKGNPRWMSMISDGGSDYSFWQFRVSDLQRSMELSGNNGRGGLGLSGVKPKLVDIAEQSGCDIVSKTIQSIPESQIFERSIVGHSSLPTWLSNKGKIVLVGDSAHGMHPNIAQGANSSFESASIVVTELRRVLQQELEKPPVTGNTHDDDDVALLSSLKEALQSYESVRKPRADYVQGFANMLGVLQSSGKNYFEDNPGAIGEMLEWIRSGCTSKLPPQKVIDVLQGYDPCSEDGISRLWN